jgi:hypothetical protein
MVSGWVAVEVFEAVMSAMSDVHGGDGVRA